MVTEIIVQCADPMTRRKLNVIVKRGEIDDASRCARSKRFAIATILMLSAAVPAAAVCWRMLLRPMTKASLRPHCRFGADWPTKATLLPRLRSEACMPKGSASLGIMLKRCDGFVGQPTRVAPVASSMLEPCMTVVRAYRSHSLRRSNGIALPLRKATPTPNFNSG